MGISRSVEVAYGFAMAESSYKLLERLGLTRDEINDFDDDYDRVLTADNSRLSLLTITLGGNSWTGPERWAIVAKDSLKHMSDTDDNDVIFNVSDTFVSTAARQQLGLAHNILSLDEKTAPIGWKLLFNVS